MLINRTSPIFWSNTDTQIEYEKYINEGFLELKGVLTNEEKLLERINNYAHIIETNQYEGRINEENGQNIRSQFNVHAIFPEILTQLINSKIYNMAISILGDEPLIYQSHINYKNAKTGGSYDWHSDYTYWKSQDGMLEPRAISIVVPLGEHNNKNGGLQVLKKSHHYYYPTTMTPEKNWMLEEIKHGPSIDRLKNGLIQEDALSRFTNKDVYQADMNFGDVLILDANTWHFSDTNLSEVDRKTLFLILYSEKTRFDQKMNGYRPNYITCRKKIKLKTFLR